MIPAHDKNVQITFIERWPAHEPRESDPHYKLFNQLKKRLHKQGLMKCAIDSNEHYGQLEIHHSKVEFAHIGDIDLNKFNKAYGLDLTDEEFQTYVETEGNLEVLCVGHHRGVYGVHSLPEPEWNVLRVAKAGNDILLVESNNLIGVTKEK